MLSNDMKIAVQKNHLGGQILYRSVDPAKKRPVHFLLVFISLTERTRKIHGPTKVISNVTNRKKAQKLHQLSSSNFPKKNQS